jgi:hypothetical protein
VKFKVTVNVELNQCKTPEDAEIDEKDLGDHVYELDECCAYHAEHVALDRFYANVPIGCLDYVEITSKVETA